MLVRYSKKHVRRQQDKTHADWVSVDDSELVVTCNPPGWRVPREFDFAFLVPFATTTLANSVALAFGRFAVRFARDTAVSRYADFRNLWLAIAAQAEATPNASNLRTGALASWWKEAAQAYATWDASSRPPRRGFSISPLQELGRERSTRAPRFMVMLAQPGGAQSDWLLAEYSLDEKAGLPALEHQFADFPTPGVRGSHRGERFDAMRKPAANGERDDEIALWPEPRSDFWSAMHYRGPWTVDLQHVDRLQAEWGARFLYLRGQAAGAIELLRDRYLLDGEQPYFNADGSPTPRTSGTVFDGLSKAAEVYPLWARLAAAVAGPTPDAQTAYECAIACISDAHNCTGLVSVGFIELPEVDDEHLMPAFKMFTECALMSPQATQEGLAKPWLANSPEGLQLKATPLELSVDVEDVRTYWRQGLELFDVLDSGLWARGSDLPYPLADLGKRMAGTTIEGGIEAAEARTMALLTEALDARQWSIPWGARVELAVGPFVGLRIYEVQGEFTCLFIDDKGRYYHVAVGLRQQRPQFCSARFLKPANEPEVPGQATGERRGAEQEAPETDEPEQSWDWDDDSQVTMQLVAAAIVRDFLVVEERETVFGSRSATRRVHGHEVRTVIYLPRVQYHRPRADLEQLPEALEATAGRSRHAVTQHLRRVGTASAAQRFLAQRYGVHLPEGFTFVRPHERGAAATQERIRIYRSRSASRMLFEVVETAPAGTRPDWFEFEKECATVLRRRGLVVRHQAAQRDGDGGIDLYAIFALKLAHSTGSVSSCLA